MSHRYPIAIYLCIFSLAFFACKPRRSESVVKDTLVTGTAGADRETAIQTFLKIVAQPITLPLGKGSTKEGGTGQHFNFKTSPQDLQSQSTENSIFAIFPDDKIVQFRGAQSVDEYNRVQGGREFLVFPGMFKEVRDLLLNKRPTPLLFYTIPYSEYMELKDHNWQQQLATELIVLLTQTPGISSPATSYAFFLLQITNVI